MKRVMCLMILVCGAAPASTFVVPVNQTSAPGNYPVALGSGAARVQEIIGNGQFSQFTSPITIVGIRVRSSPGTGPARSISSSVLITLSTTQAFPNTAGGHALPSSTYANNLGPDATVAFNGPASFSSPGCAAPGPCPFDVVLPLSTPFTYDPSK